MLYICNIPTDYYWYDGKPGVCQYRGPFGGSPRCVFRIVVSDARLSVKKPCLSTHVVRSALVDYGSQILLCRDILDFPNVQLLATRERYWVLVHPQCKGVKQYQRLS